MAALLVSIGVMMVLMSVAMPVWRHEVQREKEAELIFRGEQYARAINLYQRKIGPGNFPPSLTSSCSNGSCARNTKTRSPTGIFKSSRWRPEFHRVSHSNRSSRNRCSRVVAADAVSRPSARCSRGSRAARRPSRRAVALGARSVRRRVRSVRWSVRSVCRRRRPDRRRHHGCRQQEQGHLHPRVPRRDSRPSVDVPVFERQQSSRRRWRSGRARCSRWTAWPWRARRQRKSRPGHSRAEKSRRGPGMPGGGLGAPGGGRGVGPGGSGMGRGRGGQ